MALVEQDKRVLIGSLQDRYVRAAFLATLAGLSRRVEKAKGRLGLCGLTSTLREMIRICRLEGLFEIYTDELGGAGGASPDWDPSFQ